jgi:sulfotransferase family protein
MSGIVWLASYPKSGNTWFSIFLTNLLSGAATPIDINQPLRPPNFAAREHFDRLIGWDSSELSAARIEDLRLRAQEAFAREGSSTPIKTHDAFLDPERHQLRFSLRATRCALFLVRNPLDVAVSLSHHTGMDLDATIRFMNDPRASNVPEGNSAQLPQLLLDWSSHARSWVDASGLAVLTLRYEDLLRAPEENFLRACAFAGLPTERARVLRAIAHSRFEVLQRQEKERGFAESPPNRAFFREGRSGTGREVLSDRQVGALRECHEAMMRRFGYWDEMGPSGGVPA